MKKTVLYEKIDGHDVIMGFDRPTVDPVETAKIVNEAIKDTSEFQVIEAKKAEYTKAVQALSEIQKKYRNGGKPSREDQDKWNHALGVMSLRQDELKPLAVDLADKIISLRREHAVYFEPRLGEVIKTEDEVNALADKIKSRKPGIVITVSGDMIEDNRGRVFFHKSSKKWIKGKILRLGDKIPSGATLEVNVTDTQRDEIEKDRVSALPESEKATERTRAMNAAINTAADMRSKLEIQSDPKALEKSQAAYQEEVARIEGLYG